TGRAESRWIDSSVRGYKNQSPDDVERHLVVEPHVRTIPRDGMIGEAAGIVRNTESPPGHLGSHDGINLHAFDEEQVAFNERPHVEPITRPQPPIIEPIAGRVAKRAARPVLFV